MTSSPLWPARLGHHYLETGQTFANWIPGARLAVMDGCGHWAQFEDPATFNRLQLDFLLDNTDAAPAAA